MSNVSTHVRRVFAHPSMIAHMVVVSAYSAVLMVFAVQSIGPRAIVLSFMAGWMLWTFFEYGFNRWLLHAEQCRLFFVRTICRHHARHHQAPEDVRYSFPHPLIILIPTLILFLLALATIGVASLSLTSGFLFGCWLFCLLHVLQHHYTIPFSGYLNDLWQHHYLHHHRYPNRAFGVSTQLWDRMFGTLPPRHLFLQVKPLKHDREQRALYTIEVKERRLENVFLDVPDAILHRYPDWIPYLRPEIRSIFDPVANPFFRHGAARRWILTDSSGEVLGRIAAFVNFRKMYEDGKKVGCIGFFECVDNREAAFYLFDTAIQWLVARYGVVAVDGPVNFGENDKYWGLLIKGFTAPSYGMNFNPPYYQTLFEAYGFNIQYKQLTSCIDLRRPFPERVIGIARRVIENGQYTFKPFRYHHRDHFIKDFVAIYNQAWASFRNFHPMDPDVVRRSLAEIKPIINMSVIWFAYAGDRAVGLLLAVPDVNEIVRYAGGKFNAWGQCKFMFYKRWKGFSRLRVLVMGVVPEFQRRGLESALIVQAYRDERKMRRYEQVQLAWVGDFNDKMIAVHKAVGATEEKQHATFRKVL